MTTSTNIPARPAKMTGAQLREALEMLGISQMQFARMTGYSLHSVQGWVSGRRDGKMPGVLDLIVPGIKDLIAIGRIKLEPPRRQTKKR
jgi:transcriptional regulator with XRE-family HTH domain